jgi:type II secretory pathway component PulC
MDGGRTGFVFRGIRPKSIYAKCGFRNGDVWVQVNDVLLTSPDQALVAYRCFRDAPSLDVALVRDGRRMHIRVDLR